MLVLVSAQNDPHSLVDPFGGGGGAPVADVLADGVVPCVSGGVEVGAGFVGWVEEYADCVGGLACVDWGVGEGACPVAGGDSCVLESVADGGEVVFYALPLVP